MTNTSVCVVSEYFGFGKGSNKLWEMLERKAREKIEEVKTEKGKIPSSWMTEIINGILSSYKFSPEFVVEIIIP